MWNGARLIQACQDDDFQLAAWLIKAGACLDIRPFVCPAVARGQEFTALMWAVHHSNPRLVKMLLDSGATPGIVTRTHGVSAFRWARTGPAHTRL